MKKMIKFLPLVVLPSLLVMACANAQTNNKVSQDETTNNANGITEYKVTVDFDGGTNKDGDPTQELKVRKGTYYKYFEKNMPTKDDIVYPGRELKHYSLTSGSDPINGETYRFESDVRIYAVYNEVGTKHTVTWKNDGGTVLDTEAYYEGETPTYKGGTPTPDNPLPGVEYTFNGWDPAIKPVEETDQTYTATYSAVSKVLTVAFDTKGGEPIAPQLVFYDKTILVAPTATREGYQHTNKWYYKDGSGEEQEFKFGYDGTSVRHNYNLYCKWVPTQVTVSFNAGEGSQYFDSQTVDYDDTLKMTEPKPTKVGSTFGGWYTKEGGQGTKFIFDDGKESNPTHVTEDMMLYAKWTDITTVTLTFKIEDSLKSVASWTCEGQDPIYEIELTKEAGTAGIDPTTYTDEAGHIFTFTINDPLMVLAGWQDGTGIIYPTIPVANDNADYIAVIIGNKEAVHNVYFYDKATDVRPMFTEAVIHNGHAIRPKDPTSAGKVFKYWTVRNGTGQEFPFDTYPITTDEHLVAVYEDATYTVSFDTKGGNPIAPETVTHGGTIEKAPTATREGYHQKDETKGKWYYKDSQGKEVEFKFGAEGTGVVSDMTLYCGDWIPDKLEVSFIAGEGSQYIEPVTVGYEGTIAKAPDPAPTKEGFEFIAWYTEPEDGGTEFIFGDDKDGRAATKVTSNMTLYAHWRGIAEVALTFRIDDSDHDLVSWYCADLDEKLYESKRYAIYEESDVDPTEDIIDKYGNHYVWTIDDSKMLAGWRDDATGAVYKTIPVAKKNADYTAVIEDAPVGTVAVTFHSLRDDGTGTGTMEDYVFLTENIKKGDCAIEPKKEPTEDWDMHDFVGWYTAPQGEIAEEFNFDNPINANTDIYAHFDDSDTVNIIFRDQTGKEEQLPMAVGHKIKYNIPYWLVNDSVRVGAVGWKNVADGKEITIVTKEHDGITCEPIVDVIPFDFKLDCKAADTQYQYTIDGETSISEEFSYNDSITYHFDEDAEGTPICPDHIELVTILYNGDKKVIKGDSYYDKTTGTINIKLDGNFMTAKSIQIVVYQNAE